MKQTIVKALEHIAGVSNTNLVRNAARLLCRKGSSSEAEWADGVKCVISEKFKISY